MLFSRIVAHSKSMLQTLLMPMGLKKNNSILTNKWSVCIFSKMKALITLVLQNELSQI